MAGKDFERKVREHIGEWDLSPSDRVWQRLELSLVRRKRRRRYFALFLFSGLLVGAGAWFVFSGSGTVSAPVTRTVEPAAKAVRDQAAAEPSTALTQESTKASPSGATAGALQDSASYPSAATPHISKASESEPTGTQTDFSGQAGRPVSAGSRRMATPDRSMRQATFPLRVQEGGAGMVAKGSPARQGSHVTSTPFAPGVHDIASPAPRVVSGASVPGVEDNAGTVPVTQLATIPVARRMHTMPVPDHSPITGTGAALALHQGVPAIIPASTTQTHTRNNSIAFGLSAGIGRSAFTDGLISIQKAEADAQANGPGTIPLPPAARYDYRQNPGTAFSLGAWLRMPLARRWTWSAGLDYQRWTTKTPVGQALPASGRVFFNGTADLASSIGYAQGNQEDYRNDYHLLQVPLELSWQLNRGRRLPVLWQFGVSPGMLLSSNALVRDSASALFSHPDNQRRFQFGIRSAIMFRLMPASSRPVELGPALQYQLNPVFVDAVPDNGHLYFLGVEARIPIFYRALKQRPAP